MLGSKGVALSVMATLVLLGACSSGKESAGKNERSTKAGAAPVAFKKARLIVETNATDGDAGLQLSLDHEPWKSISISRPDGTKILDIVTRGALEGYGLTELFSESSEPPFDKFPLQEFEKLFPEGDYTFVGETIEGEKMQSTATLTHHFPAGPKVLAPKEDSTVPADGLVVRWAPVNEPAGIKIVGYRVIVEKEQEPGRALEAELPATATELRVPAEFMEPGATFKLEVMAIEVGGNQTLTEMEFKTA